MAHKRLIALVGLPSLSAIGVKCLILERCDLSVVSYATLEELRRFEESADAFVVSCDVFAGNLDYFMPRKQKTLLVSNDNTPAFPGQPNIISAHEDEAVIGEKVATLIESIVSDTTTQGELSGREKEVLRLLVAGKINKEIADELCISINTVITHRKNITAKTGIKSVSGLSIYALMNGIS